MRELLWRFGIERCRRTRSVRGSPSEAALVPTGKGCSRHDPRAAGVCRAYISGVPARGKWRSGAWMRHDTADMGDRSEIRELVENWALWRDAGDWDRFRTVWHLPGKMMATWFQGTADEFIEVNRQGWARGVRILHFLGGCSIDVAGERAIAQTKMTISQRGPVEGVLCDVVCTGRFYDFVTKHEGQWKVLHRQPIYEKDRIDPIDPAAELSLDASALATFPEGYRHLAYIQTRIGYKVKLDMPMLKGPVVEELYRRGARWLAGGALER
jgi:hypothetical protein